MPSRVDYEKWLNTAERSERTYSSYMKSTAISAGFRRNAATDALKTGDIRNAELNLVLVTMHEELLDLQSRISRAYGKLADYYDSKIGEE